MIQNFAEPKSTAFSDGHSMIPRADQGNAAAPDSNGKGPDVLSSCLEKKNPDELVADEVGVQTDPKASAEAIPTPV